MILNVSSKKSRQDKHPCHSFKVQGQPSGSFRKTNFVEVANLEWMHGFWTVVGSIIRENEGYMRGVIHLLF